MIDRGRLARAIGKHSWQDHPTHDCDPDCAPAIAAEYDRLTAEWQDRVRSVQLAPSATPTRGR